MEYLEPVGFLSLPKELKIEIFDRCDVSTLGRISCTSSEMNSLISTNAVWNRRCKKELFTNQVNDRFRQRSCRTLSPREKCRISTNWKRGRHNTYALFTSRRRYMPNLQLDPDGVWYSKGPDIFNIPRANDGYIYSKILNTVKNHSSDVVRFCSTPQYIISGGRDCRVCVWGKAEDKHLFWSPVETESSHKGDVHCVSFNNHVIVTGSRDKSVKLWSLPSSPGQLICKYTIIIKDNVWDVSFMPTGRNFISASAGLNDVPPLQLYDTATGKKIGNVGTTFKRGAGILRVTTESPHEFLSGGYDATVRLWDIRTAKDCVRTWEDPNNCGICSLDSDHQITFITGALQHSQVCFWDKRTTRCCGLYYMSKQNSPVYSIVFDPCALYAALDKILHTWNFYMCKR